MAFGGDRRPWPQGSVLGPLLFLLYVNDLPEWMKNSIKLFADDMKIWSKITCSQDALSLQMDLDQLQLWTDKWMLRLNTEKCKVMHIKHNLRTKYSITDNGKSELQESSQERDLGVSVTADLKPSAHVSVRQQRKKQDRFWEWCTDNSKS